MTQPTLCLDPPRFQLAKLVADFAFPFSGVGYFFNRSTAQHLNLR